MSTPMFKGRAKKVVEGRNGRLLITDFGAPDTDPMLTEAPLAAWRLRRWRLTLEHHARILAQRGIPLVMLIAPDAYTAWADDLPDGWPRPNHELGRVFAETMAGIPNLTVLYPLAALRQAQGGLPTGKKHDTHWSVYAAFIAYRQMIAALPPELPIRRIGADEVSYAWRDEYGDLGANAEFDIKGPVARAIVDGPQPEIVRRSMGLHLRSFAIGRSAGPTARALMLRDSFAAEMYPFIFPTFGELWFVGPTLDIDQNLIAAARPDVVILQTCERMLVHHAPYYEHFGWRELFDIDATSPAGKLCWRMAEAYEYHGAEAAVGMASQVAAADGLQAQHLVHCAQLCLRTGQLEQGRAYARRAVQLDRALPTAWRLLANTLSADPDGDEDAWRKAARRMLRLAPYNPRSRHDYAYGLVRFGRRDEAVADLRLAIEAFPHYPELRLLLGRLLRRAGDRPGATEVLAPAVDLLDPASDQQQAAARFVAGGPWKLAGGEGRGA